MNFDSKIYDSIVISSCLFGSVYLFSNSLKLLNDSMTSASKNSGTLVAINGLTFVMSGSMFIYGIVRFNHTLK